ncbi:MAG: energy transducer TonB [Crocinitomicaceae bacterium]|nr:energy transducer TonB [Crocinitomicaceae bacterium]
MKLEIKEPCNEDWNNMKIGIVSRHCDVCEKGVMDFTKMNRSEIITYLLSNPNDEVCGRMNRDQFDFRHEDIPILVETLKKQRTVNPFLILALVCLSLSSCAQGQSDTTTIKTPPPIETYVIGKVASPDELKNQINTSDSLSIHDEILQGEVVCESVQEVGEIQPFTMGEIYVPVVGEIKIVEEPAPIQVIDERIHQFAEKMPEFPGGVDSLFAFINSNINYPKYERNHNIQGNVYVRFEVDKAGQISNPQILKSVQNSKFFNDEVLRLIKSMPKWIPGENQGKKVSTYMTLPIRFNLK